MSEAREVWKDALNRMGYLSDLARMQEAETKRERKAKKRLRDAGISTATYTETVPTDSEGWE